MTLHNRRSFAAQAGLLLAGLTAGMTKTAIAEQTPRPSGISHSSAAIHQQIAFAAAPPRLYQALTIRFGEVVPLSAAMNSSMKLKLGTAPDKFDAKEGGAFSWFGGYVTGRNLELVPDTRIVQAWRAGSWDTGIYSIARFVLVARGESTLLVFDHTGFPSEAASHLAAGWYGNYWDPLAKFLA